MRKRERSFLSCDYFTQKRCSFSDCQCHHLSKPEDESWCYVYDDKKSIRQNMIDFMDKLKLKDEAREHYQKVLDSN